MYKQLEFPFMSDYNTVEEKLIYLIEEFERNNTESFSNIVGLEVIKMVDNNTNTV